MDRKNSKQFFKIFVIYFVILIAFVGVRIASNFGLFDFIENEIILDLISTGIIQIGILFLLPLVLYLSFFKKKPKQVFQDFGYKKLGFKAILICFGIGILAYVLNVFVSNFFAIVLNYIGYNPQYSSAGGTGYDTLPKFLFGILSVAILPAICEEFVHRGLILRGTSSVIGYKKAILLSSLLFGLMHLNISQFFYATVLGLLMGLVATMTRSIWPATIIHFCNNFINVFLSYAESSNLFNFSITSVLNDLANQSTILFFIVSITIVGFVVFGILYLIKKLFMITGANEYNKMFENLESKIRSTDGNNMSDEEVVSTFHSYVFPNLISPSNIYDLYINDNKHYGNLEFKYKIPLISCLVLGGLITMFTFIWGVV